MTRLSLAGPLLRKRTSKRTNISSKAVHALLALCGLTLTLACTSTPFKEATVVGEQGSAEGQWRGKAMVRNTRTGKNGILDLDIIAIEPAKLRMEVTGSFGVHVASIAMNGKQVEYVLPREKRFVTTSSNADAFAKLVPVHIPPAALMAVLFDRTLPSAEWSCDVDPTTRLPVFCSSKKEDVGVRWIERLDHSRRFKVLSNDAEIEMVLDESKSKVESGIDAFSLKAPEGYKEEHL